MKQPDVALIWGGAGHAKVVKPILENMGIKIGAVYDRSKSVIPPFEETPLFHEEEYLDKWLHEHRDWRIGFVVAIGGDKGNDRIEISDKLCSKGLEAITIIHNTAHVASSSIVGIGSQILAMSVISEEIKIGKQVIVNTSASIDHECVVNDGAHIMPGATLAGCITIGECAMVGTNATILPGIKIGKFARVGAGAVVTRDVEPYTTVVGSPAKKLV